MSMFDPARSPWPGRMLAVFRVVAGLVFVSVGTMKLFGFPPPPVNMPPINPMSQLWIAGVLETFGGSAILAIMYCFFYLYLLYLAAAGPGAWSVDAKIARSRGGTAA